MSPPAPDKPALPDPSYRWTTLKAQVFLGALADFGRVGEGGLFARVWDEAQAEGRAKREARRRRSRRKATPLAPESDIFGLGR